MLSQNQVQVVLYLYDVYLLATRLMMVTGYLFSYDGWRDQPGIQFQYEDRK